MRDSFVTTTRGLQRAGPAMRLYEKAKRLGTWNPSDIDLTQDCRDWQVLKPDERDMILQLTAGFQAGEEAVTLDLLPLIMAIAREGRLEEEMFLTTFRWEEGKHTDFFRRFVDEVAGSPANLGYYHGPNYRQIFYDALPRAMHTLLDDPSPQNQARAAVTYNMVVEGVLAETGYYAYLNGLERIGLLPGTCKGIGLIKRDESRHIAYGVFLLSRLMAEHPGIWGVIEETMNELLQPAMGVIGDSFARYPEGFKPFGLGLDDFIGYATGQFQKRMDRIERARGATLDEVERTTQAVIDAGDG